MPSIRFNASVHISNAEGKKMQLKTVGKWICWRLWRRRDYPGVDDIGASREVVAGDGEVCG